ncbi:MAG: site-specific integrase [Prevotellaceae bacterium]|jgi:site-specific recombinase XerD|nr:site-specific integrase [Prevotellaceae bacterium]
MSNRNKKQSKVKEPIKLRYKALSNGNKSIYLDFYNNGKREYEFLKLYLIPETTIESKETNKETLRLANAVKSQKIVELQNTAHGFSVSGGRSKANLLDYIQGIAEKKLAKWNGNRRSSGYQQYMALYRHIKQYAGTKTTFKNVDKKFCTGFLEYLKTVTNPNHNRRYNGGLTLSENTQCGYMKKLEYVLNCAISDEVTNLNPFKQIKPENKPKKRQADVCYLTIEEVKTLENTQCLSQIIKQAFLFSCYTGLRFSDVQALTWGKLGKDSDGSTIIHYTQNKTQKHEYLPIPQKAVGFLPDRNGAKDTDKVFYLPSGGYTNLQLKTWAALAGLSKHLTFHVARHTYATLLLSLETPIETVSKNLGHSEIRTTQIYAKVVSKSQREAVNKLDGLTD